MNKLTVDQITAANPHSFVKTVKHIGFFLSSESVCDVLVKIIGFTKAKKEQKSHSTESIC